jgi:4-hydroxybenzoate polyprenyltransferase
MKNIKKIRQIQLITLFVLLALMVSIMCFDPPPKIGLTLFAIIFVAILVFDSLDK